MKNPTQRDVAKIAGVSRATVSLVINNQSDGRIPISGETINRVLKAIEELGYQPDMRAQALRSGDTKTISMIVPDLHNPHFWDNVSGIEEAAHQAGYNLMFTSQGAKKEDAPGIIRDLYRQSVDGVILMGGLNQEMEEWRIAMDRLRGREMPIVEVTDHAPSGYQVDLVISDYRSATREVMRYLFSLGHRHIGFIYGVPAPPAGLDRLEPYLDCLQSIGISNPMDWVVNCGDGIQDGYQAALRVLGSDPRPSALLVINDLLAIGVIRAAADLGLALPRDLSLVSYDDIFVSNYLLPRLTSVTKDAERMGRTAVDLLVKRIADPGRPYSTLEFEARVVYRESTGQPPVIS